jgi:UrcA family protein
MNAPAPASAVSQVPGAHVLRLALGVALLAAAGLAGAATATEQAPAIHVPYGDLNLTTDAGMQALLRRLSAASHRVCDDGASRELRRVVRAEACYRETLDNAVVAVHNERLSALYHARTGVGAT